MNALEALRVLVWPLVVLVLALGALKRFDIFRDLNVRLAFLGGKLDALETKLIALRESLDGLEKKCSEDRGVNAHTSKAVSEALTQMEQVSAQVQRIENGLAMSPMGPRGVKR